MSEKLNDNQSAWLQAEPLQMLFDVLEQAGGEVRVNGGAVRNALLGEPISDVDLSSTLLPQEVIDALEGAGHKAIPTGIDHGTITAVVERRSFEVTTLREDIETDGRHAVVKFGTDWQKDALRRDLTINALYCDRHGNLFDPLNGMPDVERRTIRFIGDAEDRIKEDYLRILRFFRFFAWYGQFRPDAEGLKASTKLKAGLEDISAERIWVELKKLLAAKDPARALLWMRTTGVLSLVLPESEKWGIDLINAFAEAEVRHRIPVDPLLRLMAIIAPRDEVVKELSKRLKLSQAEQRQLLNWTQVAKIPIDTKPDELAKILYANDIEAMLDVTCLEIIRLDGHGESSTKELKIQVGFLRALKKYQRPEFPVKGEDLLVKGVEAGPAMGELLRKLESAWVESDFKMSKVQLLKTV